MIPVFKTKAKFPMFGREVKAPEKLTPALSTASLAFCELHGEEIFPRHQWLPYPACKKIP